jgi:hypothetical protein
MVVERVPKGMFLCMARTISWIRFPASGPMMWPPRILPRLPVTILTSPVVSPSAIARSTPPNGWRKAFTWSCCLAGLLLGEPDPGDLGVGEGGPGDDAVIAFALTGKRAFLRAVAALVLGDVGEEVLAVMSPARRRWARSCAGARPP